MKKINISILAGIFIVLFVVANATAAAFYNCIINKVTPKPNGNVTLVIAPGATETRFTGKAQAQIDQNDPGAKNMLATVLTAVSLNKNIRLFLADPPSLATQYPNVVELKL